MTLPAHTSPTSSHHAQNNPQGSGPGCSSSTQPTLPPCSHSVPGPLAARCSQTCWNISTSEPLLLQLPLPGMFFPQVCSLPHSILASAHMLPPQVSPSCAPRSSTGLARLCYSCQAHNTVWDDTFICLLISSLSVSPLDRKFLRAGSWPVQVTLLLPTPSIVPSR